MVRHSARVARNGNAPGLERPVDHDDLFRRLVSQPFFAAAERLLLVRPPFLPPFLAEALLSFLPRPEPDLLPPPLSLLTVAQSLIV